MNPFERSVQAGAGHVGPRVLAAGRPGAGSTRRSPAGICAPEALAAQDAGPLDALLDLHHRVSIERLLAVARLAIAIVIFVSIASNVGALHPVAAKWLTVGYAVYAAAILALMHVRPRWAVRLARRMHDVDLVWGAVVSAVSGGVSSHAFPLFAFVLVAAAYRWGLRRTLIDGGIVVLIALAESAPALAGATPWPFEFDWFVLWVAYIVVLAVLIGVLSERMHALSFQAMALGRVMSRVGQATGLRSAMRYALGEIVRLFGARHALLVVEECDTKRLYLWRGETGANGTLVVVHEDLPNEQRQEWLFGLPEGVTTFEVQGNPARVVPGPALTLDAEGHVVDAAIEVPVEFAARWRWTALIGVAVDSRQGWRGRLYLLDATGRPAGELRLGFVQNLSRQLAPLLVELYLMRGLRSRAETRERDRLSRELHDGVIQSLVALEMRLEAVRRRVTSSAPAAATDLEDVRDLVHDEALRVRELMQRLHHVEIEPRHLAQHLQDVLERFTRNTRIETSLEWAVLDLDLSPRQCRELLAIVQEALANVRKHSGASQVTVRVEVDASAWGLIVADNGTGFGFAGHRTQQELVAHGRAPRVILQRVTTMGGTLEIESGGGGSRLEMTFPLPEEG